MFEILRLWLRMSVTKTEKDTFLKKDTYLKKETGPGAKKKRKQT